MPNIRKVNEATKPGFISKHQPVQEYDYFIGIDTGTNTGYAVWSVKDWCFVQIKTVKIHTALFDILTLKSKGAKVFLVIEDARKAGAGRDTQKDINKAQGAGSVKRDAVIWQDFCTDLNMPYIMKKPDRKTTKLNDKLFKMTTGYQGTTNEHGRDAAMNVYLRRAA